MRRPVRPIATARNTSAVVGSLVGASGRRRVPGNAVVLITLDGARAEEIFGGLDVEVLKSTLEAEQKVEESPPYQRFWAGHQRRGVAKLLPFFWETLIAEPGRSPETAPSAAT